MLTGYLEALISGISHFGNSFLPKAMASRYEQGLAVS